jgi:hypothetical protein
MDQFLTPKVVEAEKFVLRDSTGKIRAELGEGEGSAIGLKLFDGNGRCRAELVVASDGGSGLQLRDDNGKLRVILSLDQDEATVATPSLSMNARDGKNGVNLLVTSYDAALVFRGEDGKVICELPETASGNAD